MEHFSNRRIMNNFNYKKKQRIIKLRNKARLKDKTRRIKNKKRKYMLYYIFFTLILLSVTAILSLTVFFKIEHIKITSSSTQINSNEILSKTNLHYNDNLILVNDNSIVKNLLNYYPNLSNVIIKKQLPNTINLHCQFDGPKFLLETNKNNFFIISKSGRILDKFNKKPNQFKNLMHLKINTHTFKPPQKIGQFLKIPKYEQQILSTLINSIQQTNLKNITSIEITNNFEIIVIYDYRITIKIPNFNQIKEIIKTSDKIINEYIGDYEKGTLIYFKKTNRTHFIHEKIDENQ